MAVKQADKEAGFTLVEILCVLALLGLTAGLVVLNLPKPAPAFKTEMEAVVTTLNLAARQSVIDGKPRGMDVSIGRIEILKYDGEWSEDYQRDLDTAYGLELRIEDQLVDLKARDKTKEKKTQPPLIIFDATGNVTPFSLEISGANDNFILTPNARGQFQIETAS